MRDYDENTRVKIPATIQLLRLGYKYQSLKDDEIDKETRIFKNRFTKAISKINDNTYFSEEEIVSILVQINQIIRNNDMGGEFYQWLVNPGDRIRLIDFENIDNNDFAVVNELTFGPDGRGNEKRGSFRPDINILINGIPLAFLEVKPPLNRGGIQAEFKRMLDERLEKEDLRKYFNMLQFVTFSNNLPYEDTDDASAAEDVKVGSFYTTPNAKKTTFSFFRDEKVKTDGFYDVSNEVIMDVLKDNEYLHADRILEMPEFITNLDPLSPCNAFVTSFFARERLMFFLRYGIVYVKGQIPEKHVMRYPQYFAIKALNDRLERGDKRGIIWHTQGSGKTELTVYANRFLRDYYAKKGILTRFFFVVDRLDLLTQASSELANRWISVRNVSDKAAFSAELNKAIPTNADMTSEYEFTVVNIHKFESEIPQVKNDYNANVQRIFFIDEAHRSYARTGEYFKNLMIADQDAVFVALTGTPLLATKERSTMKFGEYIHKYFYDKSIADGYTLRIKRENIETNARSKIRMNLLLEDPDKSKKVIRESPEYVSAVGVFIDEDFRGFRLQNLDKTLGGMIVCSSNPQAKLMKSWFDSNSSLKTGLILSDADITTSENKEIQKSFKRNVDEYDLLIVHNMLTTGYDVAHLKKMYLLRNAHEQTLLQIISRVNRPYRAPATKKSYHYGYIVDFVDIEAEFDRTIEKYLAELSAEFALQGEDGVSFKGLVVGPEEIRQQCDIYFAKIAEFVDISNIEKFNHDIWYLDLMSLYEIRKCLNGILACRTEFLLSHTYEYAKEIDEVRIKSLLREVQNSISLKNLKNSPADTLLLLSDDEVVSIIYEFLKTSVEIMDMGKFADIGGKLGETIKNIQREYGKVKNPHQIELIRLNELLQEIFSKMEISSVGELESRNEELLGVLEDISNLNLENERIAKKYDGNYAFVKTYTDCIEMHPELPREDVEMLVARVYHSVKDISAKNAYILEKRDTFVKTVMSETIEYLYDSEAYDRLHLDTWYEDELLKNAYDNMKIFA